MRYFSIFLGKFKEKNLPKLNSDPILEVENQKKWCSVNFTLFLLLETSKKANFDNFLVSAFFPILEVEN